MALFTERRGSRHDRIGGLERPALSYVSARALAREWGIFTSADARARIAWLCEVGDRARVSSSAERGRLLGWDLVRAVAVASWAYHAYLLDLATAWATMVHASATLQRAFRSWEELGESCLAGHARFVGDDLELHTLRSGTLTRLLSGEDSPWVALAFDGELASAHAPPDLEPREVHVDPDGGADARSIEEALDKVLPGDRIVLAPGTYREQIDVEKSVEIAGRPGATIACPDACCVFVRASSVVLRDLRIVTQAVPDSEPMHAVIVHAHFARLERCDVSAARFGVYLASDKARVDLIDTVVHGCRVGVFGEGGVLVAEGGAWAGSTAANAQLSGEPEAHVARTRITGAEASGVSVGRGAVVRLVDVEIEGNRAGVDALEGSVVHIDRARITGQQEGGARAFGANARLQLVDTVLADNGAVNLGAVGSHAVEARGCHLHAAGVAAWADGGARLVLRDCRVGRGTEGVVREMNGGAVVLEDCVTDDVVDA